MPTRRHILQLLAASPVAAAHAAPRRIRTIDIYHHSHTDVGFTDLPSVCRELQVRFLDAAIDACERNPSFRWTCEALLTVEDFRTSMPAARWDAFLRTLRSGQMDVCALPFNQAPFMDALQWRQAMRWLPEPVWRQLNPRIGMQNDVNGFPRAGALHLLDRGIGHLLMGINADSGGPPFFRPSAFWWKMPDGRKLFVWLGEHYGTAYSYFEPKNYIEGQPKAAEGRKRPPRAGDHLKTDEASLRASHAQCLKKIDALEASGYTYPRLILAYTNQWRYDNDPPFPPLAPFVDAWNKLGLEPALRLTTATQAMMDMEAETGSSVRTLQGEWTDWWANGNASGPREVAASRVAKRHLTAALSPVWGEPAPAVERKSEEILRDLCLFDEHTWGANISISHPWSLDAQGQYTEKSLLAYRPMGHAEWLLGMRARTRMAAETEGVFVANTAPLPYSGWVRTKEDAKSAIWVEDLAGRSFRKLEAAPAASGSPTVQADSKGWPVSAMWPGAKSPLFRAGLGDLLIVATKPPANRGTIAKMHSTADRAVREKMRAEAFVRIPATYGVAKREETPHTFVYTQPIEHARLRGAIRRLELDRRRPRASVSVKFDRISSTAPELIYVAFPLLAGSTLPSFSNGGVAFTPFTDQIEGSCRDYYAIDAWAHYATPEGHWVWAAKDAPMVAVGGPHPVGRISEAPKEAGTLHSMVFDNFWHTNFVADSHGEMEFRYELMWSERLESAGEAAEMMLSEPVVVVNPPYRESPELQERLFKP